MSLFPRLCAGCALPCTQWLCLSCRPSTFHVRYRPSAHIHALVYLSPYDSELGALVRSSKIAGTRHTFVRLGILLAESVRMAPVLDGVEGVVAVPSPWNRRLRRGFNPSAVMTQAYGHTLQQTIYSPLHLKPGARQATLSKKARVNNFETRLSATGPVPQTIALIDDIYTTGTTLEGCATQLMHLGAQRIIGVVPCVTGSTKDFS